MVISKRYLRLVRLIAIGLVTSLGCGLGQDEAPKPLLFRAVAIGNTVPLTGLLYEHNGKPLMVSPSDASLSAPFERPGVGPVKFFREIAPVSPETKPTRVPVLTADLNGAPLSLLVWNANGADNKVSCSVINDSWEAFPVQTVRVLNFSRRKVVTQIENAVAEIQPSGIHLFPYSTNKLRISCKVASMENQGWKLQFSNSQSIIQGRRVNIIISDCEPSPMDPEPDGINVIKMIDPLLPPKKE
ncbi:MAG: hypothetical protein K0R17_3172 [Rariglobus sp.]|jgi:hypothetical protein|nr:hypothetical protein [Rariglobus sp.]